jgi:hypothetical protein
VTCKGQPYTATTPCTTYRCSCSWCRRPTRPPVTISSPYQYLGSSSCRRPTRPPVTISSAYQYLGSSSCQLLRRLQPAPTTPTSTTRPKVAGPDGSIFYLVLCSPPPRHARGLGLANLRVARPVGSYLLLSHAINSPPRHARGFG